MSEHGNVGGSDATGDDFGPVATATPAGTTDGVVEGGGPRPKLPYRYEVVRFLGLGGMGRVYLCRDTELNVEVAVKVLPAQVGADPKAVEQIRREARASAKFRGCPGILQLYGFEQCRGD